IVPDGAGAAQRGSGLVHQADAVAMVAHVDPDVERLEHSTLRLAAQRGMGRALPGDRPRSATSLGSALVPPLAMPRRPAPASASGTAQLARQPDPAGTGRSLSERSRRKKAPR